MDGVVVEDLVKHYRKNPVPAVDKVSFTVRRGEILGLLGPNGAGKTTTIGVLTTRVRPDSGRAVVSGVDVVRHPVSAKSHLGVVPQRNNLDRSLSIKGNLLFHAAYHGVPKAERAKRAAVLLEQFGLAERQNERVDLFSGGQTQRMMIARALMHSPEVLFLDEPTTGLDPAARLFVWDRVRELRQSGVTIMLTTHDMDEAASLADRVGIMDHGHLLVLDTPDALTRSLPGHECLDVTVVPPPGESSIGGDVVGQLRQLLGVAQIDTVTTPGAAATNGGPGGAAQGEQPGGAAQGEQPGGAAQGEQPGADPSPRTSLRLRLYLTTDAAHLVAPVANCLAGVGAALGDFHLGRPSLEDVFLHLTGRLLR